MSGYQLFPPLSPQEYEALNADIAARGVLVPVEYDDAGNILDGHHREQIARDLGLEFPTTTRSFATEEEKVEHVLALNLARRHLTAEQRAPVAADLRSRGWSIRRIAASVGAGVATVSRDLAGVPNGTPPEVVVGADGKRYPARAPAPPDFRPGGSVQFLSSALRDKILGRFPDRIFTIELTDAEQRRNVDRKAERLLTAGRLAVSWVDSSTIRATCRGDSGESYQVGYEPDVGWTCDCAALGRCSHVLALQRVVLVPTPRRWSEATA